MYTSILRPKYVSQASATYRSLPVLRRSSKVWTRLSIAAFKCSFVGYIIGTHENTVSCLNVQVRFLRISSSKITFFSVKAEIG
jgi:hypothetical protein